MTAVLPRRRTAAIALALLGVGVALLVLRFGPSPSPAKAASHREAPLIANDPPADITDFYMFRSTEAGHAKTVDLIMNVIPFEEPSGGPNYYNFDPSVAYTFHIDNDKDGRADDVAFEFRFKNEIRGAVNALGLPLAYVGGVPPADGSVIPPITALNSPGLGLRQKYTITMIKDGRRTVVSPLTEKITVPSNVGPRTMPDYDALAAHGMYNLGNGVRVFTGQRDDPFFIDLGAAFDTLNLRSPATDMLSGFNVNTIALEVPVSMLTRDRHGPAEGDGRRGRARLEDGAGAATGQPARERADHRHEGQGSLEHACAAARIGVPRLLREPAPGPRDVARLRRSRAGDAAARPRGRTAQVRGDRPGLLGAPAAERHVGTRCSVAERAQAERRRDRHRSAGRGRAVVRRRG